MIKPRSLALQEDSLQLSHKGSPIAKKGNAKKMFKLPYTYTHASKVMLKIFQARLQQYMNQELPDVQTGCRKKAEEPEIKLPTFVGS